MRNVRFRARSRVTLAIIPPDKVLEYRDLVIGRATNQDYFRFSARIGALALDELLATILAGYRGDVTAVKDGLISDLKRLAQFCTVAELFGLDIKTMEPTLEILSKAKVLHL